MARGAGKPANIHPRRTRAILIVENAALRCEWTGEPELAADLRALCRAGLDPKRVKAWQRLRDRQAACEQAERIGNPAVSRHLAKVKGTNADNELKELRLDRKAGVFRGKSPILPP